MPARVANVLALCCLHWAGCTGPALAQLPPECTTDLSKVDAACCPSPADIDCPNGHPISCSEACAAAMGPFMALCAAELGTDISALIGPLIRLCGPAIASPGELPPPPPVGVVGACASYPCDNGGSCHAAVTHGGLHVYSCACVDGWHGSDCEVTLLPPPPPPPPSPRATLFCNGYNMFCGVWPGASCRDDPAFIIEGIEQGTSCAVLSSPRALTLERTNCPAGGRPSLPAGPTSKETPSTPAARGYATGPAQTRRRAAPLSSTEPRPA